MRALNAHDGCLFCSLYIKETLFPRKKKGGRGAGERGRRLSRALALVAGAALPVCPHGPLEHPAADGVDLVGLHERLLDRLDHDVATQGAVRRNEVVQSRLVSARHTGTGRKNLSAKVIETTTANHGPCRTATWSALGRFNGAASSSPSFLPLVALAATTACRCRSVCFTLVCARAREEGAGKAEGWGLDCTAFTLVAATHAAVAAHRSVPVAPRC